MRCPRCGTRTEYSRENKWRPFCRERCRTIDLGRWAAEDYRVPEEKSRSDPDSSPNSNSP
ncbi:MAG TPA: DNA gyrase inhibitor YacG [Burkholderiales bacterium]|nr:DNA gyrase inhibitor YacG [Burkholderiales bacterium]HSA68368.1 DNA gyrase inhibitor YacG [Burkholderiales bacterium]